MAESGQILKKVLVVCTGNTCRSPRAEGWLNHKLAGKSWVAESAGVAAWGGDCASPEALEVMREIGIDISSHRNRALTRALVDEAAIILAMTEGHRRENVFWIPAVKEKTFLVKSFGLGKVRDVADPFGASVDAYRNIRDELVQALGDFLLYLAERGELKR